MVDANLHFRRQVHRLREAVLIALALGLLLTLAARIASALAREGDWWLLPVCFLAGIVTADFATGSVHWLCDRFFTERTPLVGAALIRPFREHHVDPLAMVRHGLLELHGNSSIPVIGALGLVYCLPHDFAGPGRLVFDSWLLFLCSFSMATNQFHMWAHAPSAAPAVRWLQRRGIILSPEAHARHHAGRFDRSYCLTSGLLNPVLDRVDFFGRLERAIRSLSPATRA